jgi:hypothetical protein
MTSQKPCTNNTPPWFVGHCREWHRGHGCDRDDGKPRSEDAKIEIEQHAANAATGFLTDRELDFLRASTTSGNALGGAGMVAFNKAMLTLMVRALDEIKARRRDAQVWSLAARATDQGLVRQAVHLMLGPPGWRCGCGATFDDYAALAEHLRLTQRCFRCGTEAVASLADGELYRWQCGHWILRGDFSATIRDPGEVPTHYPTHGKDVACACGRVEAIREDGILAAVTRVEEHVRASARAR